MGSEALKKGAPTLASSDVLAPTSDLTCIYAVDLTVETFSPRSPPTTHTLTSFKCHSLFKCHLLKEAGTNCSL